MKLTQIALTAVLVLPCAAQAQSETVKRPGPFTVPKTQFACQNLASYQDMTLLDVRGKEHILARAVARQDTDAMEEKGLRCMTITKGTRVIVKERWISRECVMIANRPSTTCFYIENVSGDKRPDYAPDLYY